MSARQGIKIKKVAHNSNAKYKIKYSYSYGQTARNKSVTTKYSYSKKISTTKKYSYKG